MSFITTFIKRRRGLLLTFAIILAIIVFSIYRFFSSSFVNIPTVPALRGEVVISITENGDIQAVRSETISSPRSSRTQLQIIEMAEEGTQVQAGDTLIQFDRRTLEESYEMALQYKEQALENLEKLEAQHASDMEELITSLETYKNSVELAELNLESMDFESEINKQEYQLMYENALISLEEQKTKIVNEEIIQRIEHNKALQNVKRFEEKIRELEDQINQLTITAPIPGLVVYREYSLMGTPTKPKVGDDVYGGMALMSLPDMSEMQLYTRVNEIDILKLRLGMDVIVRLDAYPEEIFHGKIKDISLLTSEFSSNVRLYNMLVAIEERNNPLLKPGMTASAEVILNRIPDAVYVPVESVFERDGVPIVFVIGSESQERIVTVGDRNATVIVIEENLQEGERVALIDPTGNLESLGTKAYMEYNYTQR